MFPTLTVSFGFSDLSTLTKTTKTAFEIELDFFSPPSPSARDNFEAVGINCNCGDKLYESALGEECDDGNNDSGDGCSSTC